MRQQNSDHRSRLPALTWQPGRCLIYGCWNYTTGNKIQWCDTHGGNGHKDT